MEPTVIPAYPGIKAVWSSINGDPDIKFDVVAWWVRPTGTGAPVSEGMVVIPGFVYLIAVKDADTPDGYSFTGYAYCP